MLVTLNMVGFLQLAGGTNAHTIEGLKKEGLFQTTISGSVLILLVFISFSPLHYNYTLPLVNFS